MPARQMTVCFSGYRPEKLPWGYDECETDCIANALRERYIETGLGRERVSVIDAAGFSEMG